VLPVHLVDEDGINAQLAEGREDVRVLRLVVMGELGVQVVVRALEIASTSHVAVGSGLQGSGQPTEVAPDGVVNDTVHRHVLAHLLTVASRHPVGHGLDRP
jgi:hypothetical protein